MDRFQNLQMFHVKHWNPSLPGLNVSRETPRAIHQFSTGCLYACRVHPWRISV